MASTKSELLAFCQQFISDNGIGCAEVIYQCDSVIMNAYEFIEGICEIVGYAEVEEDES